MVGCSIGHIPLFLNIFIKYKTLLYDGNKVNDVEPVVPNYVRLIHIYLEKEKKITTHAACTASDTLPALGSHQNTWHWKCWLPVSMMKANVWMSRPTPMKDRKRTRHSTSTSSSSSCWDGHKSTGAPLEHSSPADKCHYKIYSHVLPQVNSKMPLAFSLMTATVVSAILSLTGVQSSLPVEDTRLSMAPLMMSIPEDGEKRKKSETERTHFLKNVCMSMKIYL